MLIVIDGPAGTGKSTIARALASLLGYAFLDTGAMYRAITYGLLEEDIPLAEEELMRRYLERTALDILPDQRILLNGTDITPEIRSETVTNHVSAVSALPQVRKQLVTIQRKLVQGRDAVAEGRDLGTVVFPNAELKIYLTAHPEIRALRRLRQEGSPAPDQTALKQMQKKIELRDEADSLRTHSPLQKAADAVEIDTSELSIQEVIEAITRLL